MQVIMVVGGGSTMTDKCDGEVDQHLSGSWAGSGHARERTRGTGLRSL